MLTRLSQVATLSLYRIIASNQVCTRLLGKLEVPKWST